MATPAEVSNGLRALGLPRPHPVFLTALLTSSRALPPVAGLVATAKHRLLSADITSPNILDPSSLAFPANISNVAVKDLIVVGPIFVQVLSVEDLSKSRWEQIEAIEAVERGEATRGREVIRIAPVEEGENGQGQQLQTQTQSEHGGGAAGGSANAGRNSNAGPHKLVLQDVKGNRAFAMELNAVEGIGLGIKIGAKMVLKGVTVARGMIMLQPGKARLLGGKIDELDKAWLENRKADLKATLEVVA